MPFNNMNLFLSLAVLQNKGIPKDKMFAASVGAALVPGLLGLAVPLIVANNAGSNTTTGGTGTGTGAGTGDGATTTLTRVPDVQFKQEQDAIDVIKAAGLNPVVSHAYFTPSADADVPEKGSVAFQDPKPSNDWVDTGTDVRIEVSLGEAASTSADGSTIERTILSVDEDLQKKVADMDVKVDQILTKMGKWKGGDSAGAPAH